jgi:hypothetical protein
MPKRRLLVNVLAVIVLGSCLMSLPAPGSPPGSPPASPPANPGKGLPFPDLVGAVQASPGCLGVETAKTKSGKLVIFAWFEDKQAAQTWYYSDFHQGLIKRFVPNAKGDREPLADVPEDSGPIMVVASITPNDKPTKEHPSPFKQIAIELYQPLGGGLAVGGRFAPEKMKLPSPRKAAK